MCLMKRSCVPWRDAAVPTPSLDFGTVHTVLPFFCDELLHYIDLKVTFCEQRLQLGVLGQSALKLGHMGHFHVPRSAVAMCKGHSET